MSFHVLETLYLVPSADLRAVNHSLALGVNGVYTLTTEPDTWDHASVDEPERAGVTSALVGQIVIPELEPHLPSGRSGAPHEAKERFTRAAWVACPEHPLAPSRKRTSVEPGKRRLHDPALVGVSHTAQSVQRITRAWPVRRWARSVADEAGHPTRLAIEGRPCGVNGVYPAGPTGATTARCEQSGSRLWVARCAVLRFCGFGEKPDEFGSLGLGEHLPDRGRCTGGARDCDGSPCPARWFGA